jgi:M61 glycyl aminopeptidase
MTRFFWLWLMTMQVAFGADDAVPKYSITFDARTLHSVVKLCLPEAHAHVAFSADSRAAMPYIGDLKRDSGGRIEKDDAGWSADQWLAGECVSYVSDLGALTDSGDRNLGRKIGKSLLFGPEYWLLRSDTQNDAGSDVDIELSPGWSLSTPWRERGARDGKLRFHIPNTPTDWSAEVAIGPFHEERIVLNGGVLRVAVLGDDDPAVRTKMTQWITRASQALLQVYGAAPVPEVEIKIVPINTAKFPKSILSAYAGRGVWGGESSRGEGNSLQLGVDPSQPLSDFIDDWTAVHELSHLTHPYLGDDGSWLAEGLATYYQNVLRARSGLLTPAQAWERMANGFRENAKDRHGDMTLEEAARTMHRTHNFTRVYWAGTAYWLTVDRDLRRASGGQVGIDSALSRFRDCCLPSYREWKPEDFVARLDALSNSDVFTRRYREFSQMRQFPEWEKVYSDLGIALQGERLHFDDTAKDAAIRRIITAPLPQH